VNLVIVRPIHDYRDHGDEKKVATGKDGKLGDVC
jgi:hypothetical protein